jgi:FdhD protein
MDSNDLYRTVRSYARLKDKISPVSSELLVETPIEIVVNGDRYTFIMFTPGQVRELVTGFLFTEGLINGMSDLQCFRISECRRPDGELFVEAKVDVPPERLGALSIKGERISYSSCGICGTESYENLKRGMGRVKSRHRFAMDVLERLPDRLEKYQPLYRKTRGAHAAMIFDSKGQVVFHCEDMGRHNALDKVIGCALIADVPRDDKILVSTGRASLEMILKTARAGFPVFVAMSRPTSRAVEAAKFYNVTLTDMAKGTNRIYTHVRRIEEF